LRLQTPRIAALAGIERHVARSGHPLDQIFFSVHGEFDMRHGKRVGTGLRAIRPRHVSVGHDALDRASRIQKPFKPLARRRKFAARIFSVYRWMIFRNHVLRVKICIQLDRNLPRG